MKNIYFIFLILIVFACGNPKKVTTTGSGSDTTIATTIPTIENIPSCLRQTIDKIRNKQYDSPPLQIDEYRYKGKLVYLHTADCCDQYNVVYDENCKGICSPSGGIDGRGDRKCTDFKDSARLVRSIWKSK